MSSVDLKMQMVLCAVSKLKYADGVYSRTLPAKRESALFEAVLCSETVITSFTSQ
jgi:hypothetical protein